MFSVGSIGAIGRGSARSLDALWRLAGFTPSFDFPFARNRSLVDAVTGQSLIAYTQASSGTYVNSDRVITTAASNEPRFDHDPTTGESLGLLPEGQMTNLSTYSEAFDQWLQDSLSVTVNQITAPNGTLTADKIVENTLTSNHLVRSNTISVTGPVNITGSVYLKKGERRYVRLRLLTTANPRAWFDLETGTRTAVDPAASNATITGVGNGWYRCTITEANVSTTSFLSFQIFTQSDSGPQTSYTGDGTSGIYVWGAQLEASLFPTSYIPTGANTVTRSASLADLISSAIASNIRSFCIEFRSPAVGISGVVSLNDNTADNRAAVITSGTDPRLVVHSGGVEQANINGGTVTAGARTRVSVRIDNNDFAISINGAAVVTDTSGVLPIVDRIMIGRTQAGEFLNSRIARFTGWNQLLGDATLRSLSSQ